MKGFEVQIGRVHRAGLEVCDFAVKLDQAHENHDHDMEYFHGHSEYRSKERERVLESQITQHKHVHEHRSLQEILHIIEHADAAQGAKELAKKIFRILAVAVCLENLQNATIALSNVLPRREQRSISSMAGTSSRSIWNW